MDRTYATGTNSGQGAALTRDNLNQTAMIWRWLRPPQASCVVNGSFVGAGAKLCVIIRNCLLIGVKRRSLCLPDVGDRFCYVCKQRCGLPQRSQIALA